MRRCADVERNTAVGVKNDPTYLAATLKILEDKQLQRRNTVNARPPMQG